MKSVKYFLPFCLTFACADFDSSQINDVIQVAQQSAAPSQSESISATKQALDKGVHFGIGLLNKDGGFSNSLHKILIPPQLTRATDLARKAGLNQYVDAFEKSLNRAAEEAVGSAAPVFKDAISQLTFQDVVTILRGPDNAATNFFRIKSEKKLEATFLPIVTRATGKTEVTKVYKQFVTAVQPAAMIAGVSLPSVNLDEYVSQKAVAALFSEIAVQEKKIRDNPLERSTALLQKVFSFYQNSSAH